MQRISVKTEEVPSFKKVLEDNCLSYFESRRSNHLVYAVKETSIPNLGLQNFETKYINHDLKSLLSIGLK